jgi:hypothetical protein
MNWPTDEIRFWKTKFLSLRWLVCALIVIALPALAQVSVPLTWNPSADTNAAGYKIYYGLTSRVYTTSVDVGNVTNTTITGLSTNTTYYFAATTYDAAGLESAYSQESTYTTTNPVVTPPPVIYLPPTLNPISNLSIKENAGLQTVNLTGISLGSGQVVTISAASSNPALIANPTVTYSSPAAAGTLAFLPVANVSGTATITVTANNGLPQSNLVAQTFTVTIAAVNQPPTLSPIGNLTLNFNSPAQTVGLSGISSGAANQLQTLVVKAVSSNPKLVPNPAVTYSSPLSTGSLTLKPAANVSGTSVITVTVNNGGASNNLVTQNFTVTVKTKAASGASPVILNPLTNQVVLAGKTVVLNISASGSGTLQYQWRHNGTNVPGATSAKLTLKNVTASQTGGYAVTISNAAGTTNSNPAELTVVSTPAAALTSAVKSNGQFTFNVVGITGYKYAVQASTDLVNWVSVQTNTAPFNFADGNAGQTSRRYFRTVYLP